MSRAHLLREKLASGKIVFGSNVVFDEPAISELLACAGHEYVWIDMEHGAIDYKDALHHVMGAHSGGAAAFIRVPSNDPDMIKKTLDMGADGIIFPLVHNAEEVKKAMESCLYPPDGIRGYNPLGAARYGMIDGPTYCKASLTSIIRMIMLEHIDAYRDLDNILNVPGLDGVILGPSDLSGSMGKMLQTTDPEVVSILEDITVRCRKAGVFVGIALNSALGADIYVPWMRLGVQLFSVGQDIDFLHLMAMRKVEDIRKAEEIIIQASKDMN